MGGGRGRSDAAGRCVIPLTFFVAGDPAGQGSMRAFKLKGSDQVVTVHSNAKKLKPWRTDIGFEARRAGVRILSGAVKISLEFQLRRAKKDYRSNGALKPSAPLHPLAKRDDIDKFARAVLDALTNVAWIDDSQVVQLRASKIYADAAAPCGVTITVVEL